jgi:hypothetical protein
VEVCLGTAAGIPAELAREHRLLRFQRSEAKPAEPDRRFARWSRFARMFTGRFAESSKNLVVIDSCAGVPRWENVCSGFWISRSLRMSRRDFAIARCCAGVSLHVFGAGAGGVAGATAWRPPLPPQPAATTARTATTRALRTILKTVP